MSLRLNFEDAIDAVCQRDPRYRREAYEFLHRALDYTVRHERQRTERDDRHVSGQQLLEGFRELALKEFGPMALTVLEEWGLARCEDVGEMVFNLIGAGAFGQSDSDRRGDFASLYDFAEAFEKPFEPKAARTDAS